MLFNTSRGRSWAGEHNHTTGAGSISSPLTGFMINDHLALLVSDNSSSDSECESDAEGSTCSSSSESEVFDVIAEIKRKKAHPDRLHDELWYNDPGQVGLSLSQATFIMLQNHFSLLPRESSASWSTLKLCHTCGNEGNSWNDTATMWQPCYCYILLSVSKSGPSARTFAPWMQFYTKTFTWFFTLLANKSWWQYMS